MFTWLVYYSKSYEQLLVAVFWLVDWRFDGHLQHTLSIQVSKIRGLMGIWAEIFYEHQIRIYSNENWRMEWKKLCDTSSVAENGRTRNPSNRSATAKLAIKICVGSLRLQFVQTAASISTLPPIVNATMTDKAAPTGNKSQSIGVESKISLDDDLLNHSIESFSKADISVVFCSISTLLMIR